MELSQHDFNLIAEKIENNLSGRRSFLQHHETTFNDNQKESLLAYQVNREIVTIISFENSKNNNDRPFTETIKALPENVTSKILKNEDLSEHNVNTILDIYSENQIKDNLNYYKSEYYSQAASILNSDYNAEEYKLAKDYEEKASTMQLFEDKFSSDEVFKSTVVKSRNLSTEWMENPKNIRILEDHTPLIKLIPVERINENAAPVLNSLIEFKHNETDPEIKKTVQGLIENYKPGMSPVEDKLRYISFYTDDFYNIEKEQFSPKVLKGIIHEIHNENLLHSTYAKGEALNTPNHLKSNQMEQNEKQEKNDLTISGFVGTDAKMKEGQEGKLYYTISLGVKNGNDTDWKNVMVFADSVPNAPDIKKGDFLKVTGYEKTLPDTKDPSKDYTVFTVKSLDEHKTKVQMDETRKVNTYTVSANLGSDPEFKKDNFGDIAVVNVYVKKEGSEQNELRKLETRKIDLLQDLKKGDLVKITGKDGKPYVYNDKNYVNIVASAVEKVNVQKNEHNATLIEKVKAGDLDGVSAALKNGANPVVLKGDHYKDLSEKQATAIKNTIALHEDTQKKSSGVKM